MTVAARSRESLLTRLAAFLSRQDKRLLAAAAALLVVVMAGGDYLTGPDFESSIFYLLPVSFVGWFIGWRAGLIASLASALATLGVHAAFVPQRHPTIIYWNAGAWLGVYALFAVMLAEVRSLLERERHSSRIDALTGIANRRAFFEALETEMSRARRYDVPLTLAYLDVDHFKQVNDRWGHAVGDALLAAVARTLQSNLRHADLTARLGGDEFAVLLPQTSSESASAVLRKLHAALDEAMRRQGWPVTFSIGGVTFQPPPDSMQDIIQAADEAMYASKSSGRDRLVVRSRRG